MAKSRILSGIQPTNILHIGNYVGALQQWVTLQQTHDAFFCIVDLHAITVKQDPKQLHDNIRQLAAMYIAAGIDPKQSTIFVQSRVSAHAELGWVLNTLAKVSDLERMTQFKDKSAQHHENINVGLFDYPVLMAADILLYQPEIVPVGDDQSQHVELTRTLAQRFNKQFGDVFHVPKLQLRKEGARIMALDDPTKKMSKSAGSNANYIALTDSADVIRKKIRRAVTDSGSQVVFDPKRAGLYNLLTLYRIFSGMTEAAIEKKFAGAKYGDFKADLAEVIITALSPLQERYAALIKDEKHIEAILDDGAKRAQAVAEVTLKKVYDAVGLG
ncbi:MAG: tryptophan--tRNA ligase [Candidatus Kerfeldbacteria bacterium RIFCSPHIGHO2_12_FULL_48_17]|uniref:Tryptophan--tRNA ligase n=1 Tax=Candidatus Kerfeldbacteria bacterium RIFCSPHIGHO2_12_FULL_48_17 TaxID=1798542 RepID=A0A1G2B546_9BACT|nr:MAG: tryptophan--tRNA ligase [Candidatus Kerfeldbacteria bacterium RIFCSPHIGHO2_12_FULL_48_17]